MEIQHVDYAMNGRVSFGIKFLFRVIFKGAKIVFYTKNEEERSKWVTHILDAVKYCQLHKIGRDSKGVAIPQQVIPSEDGGLSLDSFKILEEIGAGSFGTVFRVQKKETKEIFAMKKLSKKLLLKKKMLKYAVSECKIMKDLNHPFILALHSSFENENYIYLILEFCPGGDLESQIEKHPLSESQAKFYLAEMIVGLEYLHSHEIIYRDLKPSNILLDQAGHIKLADFGIARVTNDKEEAVSTLIGSPAYISPEVLCHEKLSKLSDIYSLGIAMHELITGIIPFSDLTMDKLLNCIKTSAFEISDTLNEDAKDLIMKLIDRNTLSRPTFQEIKKHSFFKGVNWNYVKSKKYSPSSFD